MNETFLCTANDLAIGYGKTPLLSGIALGVQPISPTGISTASATASASAFCWPGPCASSRR